MKPEFNLQEGVFIGLVQSEDLKDEMITINKTINTGNGRTFQQRKFYVTRSGSKLSQAEESFEDLKDERFNDYYKSYIDSEGLMVISNDKVRVGDFIRFEDNIYLVLSEDCEELFDINECRECTPAEIERVALSFLECECSRF